MADNINSRKLNPQNRFFVKFAKFTAVENFALYCNTEWKIYLLLNLKEILAILNSVCLIAIRKSPSLKINQICMYGTSLICV